MRAILTFALVGLTLIGCRSNSFSGGSKQGAAASGQAGADDSTTSDPGDTINGTGGGITNDEVKACLKVAGSNLQKVVFSKTGDVAAGPDAVVAVMLTDSSQAINLNIAAGAGGLCVISSGNANSVNINANGRLPFMVVNSSGTHNSANINAAAGIQQTDVLLGGASGVVNLSGLGDADCSKVRSQKIGADTVVQCK